MNPIKETNKTYLKMHGLKVTDGLLMKGSICLTSLPLDEEKQDICLYYFLEGVCCGRTTLNKEATQ